MLGSVLTQPRPSRTRPSFCEPATRRARPPCTLPRPLRALAPRATRPRRSRNLPRLRPRCEPKRCAYEDISSQSAPNCSVCGIPEQTLSKGYRIGRDDTTTHVDFRKEISFVSKESSQWSCEDVVA